VHFDRSGGPGDDVSVTGSGKNCEMILAEIQLEPFVPLALWCALAIGGVLLLGWYASSSYRRLPRQRWLLVVLLMGTAVALPMLILLNPTWIERVPPPAGKPRLTILVDASASMETEDAIAEEDRRQSRYDAARALANETERTLADRYDVEIRAFADRPWPVTANAAADDPSDAPVTDMARAIDDALQDRPEGHALLLLGDGIHNAGGGSAALRQSASKARAMAAPIYAKVLGGQADIRDLDVSINMPQELAFVGQSIPVTVSLSQRGGLMGNTRLSVDCNGEAVQQRDVQLDGGDVKDITFDISQDQPGLYRYDFVVEQLAQEVTPANNTATLMLRVVDEPVRVLLLEGKPYWDTKFLVRTLVSDPSIELVSMVEMAEGRVLRREISRAAAGSVSPTGDGEATDKVAPGEDDGSRTPGESAGPSPPQAEASVATVTQSWTVESDADVILADPDALSSFQIVILGRDADRFLGGEALANLKKWVSQQEGSLVCYRGAPASQISQRLGQLMPVRWTPMRESRFRMRLTDSGQRLAWLPQVGVGGAQEDPLAKLPSLATSARAERPKPLAVVLATGAEGEVNDTPALTYQPVGMGRVVVFEGAGMWRWAFLPPKFKQHDQLYGVLWRSLIRWLVAQVQLLPSETVALRSDKVTFSDREPAMAVLMLKEDTASPDAPQVELSGTGLDEPRMVQPIPMPGALGQYRVALGRLPEGRYELRVSGADEGGSGQRVAFDVRGNLNERLDVAARPDIMRMLAEQSGGKVVDQFEPQNLAAMFDEHLARIHPERTVRNMAWDRWWVLVGVIGIWAVTWGVRRSSGLV
jgi:hypothetical protein